MSGNRQFRKAFTLIELLAVVLVIAILCYAIIGVSRYVSNRAKIAQTRALLAALEAAIESYKADQGYYPRSTIYRLSFVPWKITTNSWLLYRALTTPKQYMKFKPDMIGYERDVGLTNIVDAWDKAIVYYCPGTNITSVTTTNFGGGAIYYGNFMDYYMIGGQVNQTTYDLFSFGPDSKTLLPGFAPPSGSSTNAAWVLYSSPGAALDDIWVGR